MKKKLRDLMQKKLMTFFNLQEHRRTIMSCFNCGFTFGFLYIIVLNN